MTRKINDHKVNPANDVLEIEVIDQPGCGGACHFYKITGADLKRNPSVKNPSATSLYHNDTSILFQNGPIGEKGVNGITQEVLIAICIDRLRGFQSGPFASRENGIALTKLEEAQMWLQKRTRDRMARGVEGTHLK